MFGWKRKHAQLQREFDTLLRDNNRLLLRKARLQTSYDDLKARVDELERRTQLAPLDADIRQGAREAWRCELYKPVPKGATRAGANTKPILATPTSPFTSAGACQAAIEKHVNLGKVNVLPYAIKKRVRPSKRPGK